MPTSFSFTVPGSEGISAGAPAPTPDQINSLTAIRDLALDPTTGDLLLEEGDLVFLVGVEAIASDIESAVKTFGPGQPPDDDFKEGEWFLDTTIGVDYWGKVLRGSVTKSDAEQAFIMEVLKRPGVVDVVNVVSTLEDRELDLQADVLIDTGQVISIVLRETLLEGVEGEE